MNEQTIENRCLEEVVIIDLNELLKREEMIYPENLDNVVSCLVNEDDNSTLLSITIPFAASTTSAAVVGIAAFATTAAVVGIASFATTTAVVGISIFATTRCLCWNHRLRDYCRGCQNRRSISLKDILQSIRETKFWLKGITFAKALTRISNSSTLVELKGNESIRWILYRCLSIYFTKVPVFLAEIAPMDLRGTLTTLNQAMDDYLLDLEVDVNAGEEVFMVIKVAFKTVDYKQ
ncbi:hypothetical protein BUALT_Bualt05G0115400 [Buddleja alternifolia]|uniref:Uncharacterized protein n=1 Tax=Buddleja alternifolia TaxID=168488 RepID=A0AAV6XQE3_9LAMI|nr:hypothetical protein BUALT_Bualt05G0115400 [Buddleja alternifolia]